MDDAACVEVGTEFFFPDMGESNRDAKAICAPCPVRAQCLAFGMGEAYGVWGGLSEKERRRLKRAA